MVWPGSDEASRDEELKTGVGVDILQRVGRASVVVPDGFVSRLTRCCEYPHSLVVYILAGGLENPSEVAKAC